MTGPTRKTLRLLTELGPLAFCLAATAAGAGEAVLPALDPEGMRLAYLDPGAGSLVIQALIAVGAASLVTGKLYWHKIKTKLGFAADAGDDDGDLVREDEPATGNE